MTRAYIDTSFLLSILFEDDNCERSVTWWNDCDEMFSSALLEIEARVGLFRQSRLVKDKTWFATKEQLLGELLENINRRLVDEEIVQEIRNYDQLKNARSLDSIHLATANILSKLTDEPLLLCSYDTRMIDIGRRIGLKTPAPKRA